MQQPPADSGLTAADLAPGDGRSVRFDWAGVTLRHVHSSDDPEFAPAYAALWAEFGDKNELESANVLAARLARTKQSLTPDGDGQRYELVVIRSHGEIAAVADHTAVVRSGRPGTPAVVHVSHVLVTSQFRGSGLAGWIRALPIVAARRLMSDTGSSPRPITLVGEMEHAAIEKLDGAGRLIAFERAGFLKVDPARVPYAQPDFRPPQVIAADRLRPVPLSLVVRRVGQEGERAMAGLELNELVSALGAVYCDVMGKQAKALFRAMSDRMPRGDERVRLVPPTTITPPSHADG